MNAKSQSSNRSTPLEVNDAGIPNELKARYQWLNWDYEERTDARGNSRFTKVPKMPSGQPASSTDRSTWSSYADCHAAYREGAFDGIGIVIADDDDLVFGDFDHIVRPDTPTPVWALNILEAAKLEDAYIEVSVGGDGAHMIGKVKKFTAGRRVGALELYPSGRFSTITGHAIHKPDAIGTLDRTLELICKQLGITRDELYAPAPRLEAANSTEHRKCPATDEQVLEKAKASKNHSKFQKLFFEGEIQGYNSPSEADLALAGLLAFWTGPDPETIERLMRQSKLLRPKWDDHRSYLVDTILHALEGRTEFYAWQSIIHPPTTVTATSATSDSPAQIDSAVHPTQTSAAGGLIAPYSDSANSHLLVQKFGSDIRFTEDCGWMVFSSSHFFRDPEGVRIMAIAKNTAGQLFASAQNAPDRDAAIKHAKQSQNRRALESMEVLARAEPGVLANINDFDADPWLLNVQNGTIDLRTRQLRPHRAADLISKIAGTHYDPSATATIWHQFLDRVMAGDHKLISYLQRVIGYSLTGFSNERALHFFYGDGCNGKSVFSEVILYLSGGYGLVMGSDLLMARMPGAIPNDIAALRGQRVVFLNETQQGSAFDEQKLKALTGGDTLSGRFLHREFFSFSPAHKLFLRGNHKPLISGSDDAIWGRLRMIPFNVVIPEQERDPNLLDKLRQELPGILNWALEGVLAWRDTGLKPPETVLAAVAAYRTESDTLSQFLDEQCERDSAAYITASELQEAYAAYCKSRFEKPVPTKDLPNEMARRGIHRRRTSRARVYEGVRFRETNPLEALNPMTGGGAVAA